MPICYALNRETQQTLQMGIIAIVGNDLLMKLAYIGSNPIDPQQTLLRLFSLMSFSTLVPRLESLLRQTVKVASIIARMF